MDKQIEKVKVLHSVAIMNRGGEETFIMNLFRSMDRSRIGFDFICTVDEEGAYDEEIKKLGGSIYHLKQNRINGKRKQIDNTFLLYKFLRNHNQEFDVFHIHTQHAMNAFLSAFAAKMAKIPVVIVHSHNTNTLFHRKAHYFFRPLLNMLRIVRLACSEVAGTWMYGNNKFRIVRNGIILDEFEFNPTAREAMRKKQGWENNYIIGHVGRFNNQKNHRYVINVFNELLKINSKYKLILVGDGENYDSIKDMVKELQIDDCVEFLGIREDVNHLYQAMDMFLFPSIYEGLPVVLVETQTSGLNAIISDSITQEIDITDLIHRESIEDLPDLWAEKIEYILNQKKMRQSDQLTIRKAGYDIKTTAKEISNLYIDGNF